MSLTIAPFSGKWPRAGLRHIGRALAAIACIALLTGVPAQAGPVHVNNVLQTLSSLQGSTQVQLTLVSQDPASTGTKSSTPTGGPRNESAPVTVGNDPKLDALLGGFPIVSDNQQLGVDVGDDAEVEGTICDCGEIFIAGGGFPKWPLLFLAAVPLVFIDHEEDIPESTPTPTPPATPTPTPPGVPEPASLLLFGTGLVAIGAGLRRRYTKSKLAGQQQQNEE